MTQTQSLVVATEEYPTIAEAMLALQALLDDSLSSTLELLEQEGSRLWSIESGSHAITVVPTPDEPDGSTELSIQRKAQYVATSVVLITFQERTKVGHPSL